MTRSILLMIPVLVLTVQPAVASQLSGYVTVDCAGDMHAVSFYCQYFDGSEGEYTKIVLKREIVGLCEPSVLLMDDAIPFTPEIGPENHYNPFSCTFELAVPHPDVVYLYFPYAVKADGSLQFIQSNCADDLRGYAWSDCGVAPFSRGTVEAQYYFGWVFWVETCEEDCWLAWHTNGVSEEEFEALAGESPWDLLGSVVDIYGGRTYCRMLGGPTENVTRIERAPLGACGPVPDRQTSWGSLKVQYR